MTTWSHQKLGDLFDIQVGGDLQKSFYSETIDTAHQYPIFSNSLSNKGLYGYTSNARYPSNCVTITGRGSLGHAEYRDCPFDAIVRLLVLIPKIKVSCLYVAYYINSFINFAIESTGVPQLPAPRIKRTKILIPADPSEQRAIAGTIAKVDEAIDAVENSIKSAERLKKSLMQNLLTGKLKPDGRWRSKDEFQMTKIGLIPKDWSIKTVKELSTQVTDGEHSTPKRSETGFYLLSARNIKNSYLDLSNVDYVSEDELRKIQRRCYPQAGNIIISCSGTIGNVCIVPEGLDAGMVRSAALVKLKEDMIEANFAELMFQSYPLQIQMKVSVASSVQGNIFQGAIKKLRLPYPPNKSERDEISNCIKEVSDFCVKKKSKIQNLKKLKKSLMQNLLTGKVRVDVEKINKLLEEE